MAPLRRRTKTGGRNLRITVRVSPREYYDITALATHAGLSLGAFLIQSCLGLQKSADEKTP